MASEPETCATCRFWSEMIASVIIGQLLEAVCLNAASPMAGDFVTGRQSCEAWQTGDRGAIDAPGGNPYEES